MSSDDLKSLRAHWVRHLMGTIRTTEGATGHEDPRQSVERALIEVHVGLSHLFGADQQEAALEGFCTPEMVEQIVSRWRAGGQSLAVMGELRAVWRSLWSAGIWSDLVSPELSAQIAMSYLCEHTRESAPTDDPLAAFESSLLAVVSSDAVDETWDCDSTHLARVRGLPDRPAAVLDALLPLERRALVGARRDARLETSVESAAGKIHIDLAMRSGWGGPNRSDIPPWLRDYAIARGGRIFQERAGVMPCWFFVAESVDELRAISAWRHVRPEVAVGTRRDRPNEVLLFGHLEFNDGGNAGVLEFLYNTTSIAHATSLDMVAWVELIRLEVYVIEEGDLEFAFATGIEVSGAREPLINPEMRAFPDEDWLRHEPPSTADVLFQMQNAQRVQFEWVRRGEEARARGSASTAAYLEYLRAVDGGARSDCAGIDPDQSGIERARRSLLAAFSLEAPPAVEIALDPLGSSAGLLQLGLITDEPQRVAGALAYTDARGEVKALSMNLMEQSYASGQLEADNEGLDTVVGLSLHRLVLSPAGPLYALALHEDFLDEGVREVSYAHSPHVIAGQPLATDAAPEIFITGWAGDSDTEGHLNFLEAELRSLEGIYGALRSTSPIPQQLPAVVHLAGHGVAGKSATEHWLRASRSIDNLISPARVLLDLDASSTQLVYLSACSSGRGVFTTTTVMESVPLDVAFLERGATCVVSTSAPVNDAVSSVFAIAFHSAWRAGASVWDAYVEARAAASQKAPSALVAGALEEVWPTWTTDLAAASSVHPEDWMRFRVSGRHW